MYISNSTSSASSAVSNAAQEAKETPAQTKAEAAKGDQQAVRKLAQQQQAAANQTPPATVDSDKGQLDAKA